MRTVFCVALMGQMFDIAQAIVVIGVPLVMLLIHLFRKKEKDANIFWRKHEGRGS